MKQIHLLLALVWIVSWKLETGEVFVKRLPNQKAAELLYQRLHTLSHVDCAAIEGFTPEQERWEIPICLMNQG